MFQDFKTPLGASLAIEYHLTLMTLAKVSFFLPGIQAHTLLPTYKLKLHVPACMSTQLHVNTAACPGPPFKDHTY